MSIYQARRSKAALLIMLTGFITLSATAQEKHAFSVKQAVEYAMKNNVQVRNALIDIQIQQQTNKEITGAALPQVSGSIDVNHNPKITVQSFPNFISEGTYRVLVDEGVKDANGNPIVAPTDFGFIQAPFGVKWNSTAGISLNQLLFDGQVFIGLKAKRTSVAWATAGAAVTQEQIKANVYKVYYQLVVGRQQMGTIDANIDRYEKLHHDTKALYDNGFAEKLDVDKVDVVLANLRTEKEKLNNTIESGLLGLKFLMGMPMKTELVLTDSLSETELKTDVLDTAYNYADRKEYQYAELSRKMGQFNVRRYEYSKYPTVSLLGNFSKMAQRNKFDFFDSKQEWFTSAFIGLRLSVPIFEGFAKNARIARAKLELQQTANSSENLKLQIDNEVQTANINLKSALVSMSYQRKNMELAENVYNQTKKKFEQGLGSNLEITTSHTELRTAQVNYYSSLYDAIIARIDFLKAIGKL
jgi:outer membrane protein